MKLRRVHWVVAAPSALLGGTALDAATPEFALWPLAFVGVVLILGALWHQRAVLGLLYGALAGAAFWFPHLSWLTLYLGPIPWAALAGLMTAWFALFGLAIALATTSLTRLSLTRFTLTRQSHTRVLFVPLTALVVAGLWIAREQVQGFWPYGGFAWGRLAHTQAEGPLNSLAPWLGFSGLSGVMVLIVALPIAAFFMVDRLRLPLTITAATAAAAVAVSFVPIPQLTTTGTITIAAVQGNSKSGIFDDRENGDVIRTHIEATEQLLDELERERRVVDVIVWPENSAEFDIRGNEPRTREVAALSERADAPILVGSILKDGDEYTNSSLLFNAEGPTAVRYDKRRPVPFAEYMPNREFFHAFVPDLVDLVQLEYEFGERPTVLPIETEAASFGAGIAICFDIIFDDQARLMVEEGAEVLFAPTNNADFGRTDQSAQQLQIARLRAIEAGRALVNISTVGTSAIVSPDGSDLDALTPHTSGSMVAKVPLKSGLTPAFIIGPWIAGAWVTLGLGGLFAGLVVGFLLARGSRRSASPEHL